MLKTVFGAISAGIMIAIGGSVFLSCDSKYVGAVLFSVALLAFAIWDIICSPAKSVT